MDQNLKDILTHLSTEIDQETLLLYLQGKLTPEKQHELEKHLLDNEFAADALEGIQHMQDKRQLATVIDQLNNDLKKKTTKRKAVLKKRYTGTEPWLLITLVIILLLIITSYIIIFRLGAR